MLSRTPLREMRYCPGAPANRYFATARQRARNITRRIRRTDRVPETARARERWASRPLWERRRETRCGKCECRYWRLDCAASPRSDDDRTVDAEMPGRARDGAFVSKSPTVTANGVAWRSTGRPEPSTKPWCCWQANRAGPFIDAHRAVNRSMTDRAQRNGNPRALRVTRSPVRPDRGRPHRSEAAGAADRVRYHGLRWSA